MTKERTEGWAYPTSTATRPHYFRNARSLCGRYGYTGLGQGDLEPDTAPKPDDCSPCRRKLAADDPNDPTGWPTSQQEVLRWLAAEGGWNTSWQGAPRGPARQAVEARLGLRLQREHLLHESPWYGFMDDDRGRAAVLRLAAMLPDLEGPWSKNGAHHQAVQR